MIIRKSAQEIEGMARAGELVHETLSSSRSTSSPA